MPIMTAGNMLNRAVDFISSFDWRLLIGLLGALAWAAPWVYEHCQRPQIKGRVLSHVMNQGKYRGKEGLIYFFAFGLISLRKQFNIKRVEARIKFPSSREEYSASVCWFSRSEWVIDGEARFSLQIPHSSFLGFMSALPKDSPQVSYLTFFVDKGTMEEFEYVRLIFIPYRGRCQDLVFRWEELDPDLMLWDHEIWKPLTGQIG